MTNHWHQKEQPLEDVDLEQWTYPEKKKTLTSSVLRCASQCLFFSCFQTRRCVNPSSDLLIAEVNQR